MKIAMASILYSGAMPQLEGTSDADFAADKADCKPVSRCVLTTDGAIIL